MSANPSRNTTSIATSGDITSGRGMFGMTTTVADTSLTPILQTPGAFYSDYYAHYMVSLSQNGEFRLAQIGPAGVSVGYTMCINCTTGPGQLTVRAFDSTVIAVMVAGDKLLLTATGSTSSWRSSFAVPQGQNNYLLVYNGNYPRVQTLPVQKEISIDGSQQYGIKCLTSFDFDEPAFWTAVAQTNANRIVSLANTNSAINTTGLTSIANHVTIASDTCNAVLTDSSLSSIISSKTCDTAPILGGISSTIASAGCSSSNASGLSIVLTSNDAKIDHNGNGSSTIIGSTSSQITNANGNNLIVGSVKTFIDGPSSNISSLSSINCNIVSGSDAMASVINCEACDFKFTGASRMSFMSNISSSFTELRDSFGSTFISNNSIGVSDSGGSSTHPFDYSFALGTVGCALNIFPGSENVVASGMIASTNSALYTYVNGSTASLISASDGSLFVGSTNCHVTASSASSFQDGVKCFIAAGDNNQFYDRATMSVIAGSDVSAQTSTIISSIISSDNISMKGDGNNVYNSGTGYPNIRAGVTILSSHLINPSSAGDLRYCVIGGYNDTTWSIDSKTGNYYGLGIFNAGTPLPGLAELYENLIDGKLPYGRLLQIEDGKVRLAANGEVGFMISRPYETAAFVGGNPYYDWPKKFLTDEFGLPMYKDYTQDEYKALLDKLGQTDTKISEGPIRYKVLNPDYDPTKAYVPRSNREDQWTTCEKSGIVVVEYKGSLSIGDCIVSAGEGIAKQSVRKTNIKVIDIINEQFAKVDIENILCNDYIDIDGSTVVVPAGGSYATGLPTDVAIRSLSFTDDTLKLAKPTNLKMTIDFTGDMTLATDLLVCLRSDQPLWFDTVYARTSGAYKVKSTLKATVPAGEYKINFVTSKTLPAKYTGYVKLY